MRFLKNIPGVGIFSCVCYAVKEQMLGAVECFYSYK